MKYSADKLPGVLLRSHLTRGAWIEMCIENIIAATFARRTSHEVRGLKYGGINERNRLYQSHLTRGAWIEMIMLSMSAFGSGLSHLIRGAWIEIALGD